MWALGIISACVILFFIANPRNTPRFVTNNPFPTVLVVIAGLLLLTKKKPMKLKKPPEVEEEVEGITNITDGELDGDVLTELEPDPDEFLDEDEAFEEPFDDLENPFDAIILEVRQGLNSYNGCRLSRIH